MLPCGGAKSNWEKNKFKPGGHGRMHPQIREFSNLSGKGNTLPYHSSLFLSVLSIRRSSSNHYCVDLVTAQGYDITGCQFDVNQMQLF